ncbi:IclR family transcriptional regulator [Saccharopolyspora sp. CA-218241]|uniref:IclR family transcriptional regulator n=1 Tax=Saccharopolyspora sp. CA-218241 TaxID=3240027 RepID=UPI003D962C88
MTRGSGEPTLIASVQRAFHLLEEVSRRPGGATAKTLSRCSGIALPTTYHLLRTLVHDGYLAKLDDGAFVLGERVREISEVSREHTTRHRLRTALANLRDELRAAVYLARYHDGEVEVTEVVDSPRAPRVDTWVDFREAAHATAIGKCLLATLSSEERADHFSRHPPLDLTPRTRTRVRELVRSEPAALASDSEEYALGTACLAVAVPGWSGPVTLATSFPARRLGRSDGYTGPLTETARDIGRLLAVSGSYPMR